MDVLVVTGSIRSQQQHTDKVVEIVDRVDSIDDYIEAVNAYQESGHKVANSDILAGASLLGAKAGGANTRLFPLVNLFPVLDSRVSYTTDGNQPEIEFKDTLSLHESHFEELKANIREAGGLVLSTPVYFGDRSSVANKLLQLSGIHGLIEEKVFGAVSVGAKRNGGQETAIIYSLLEAMNQNALIVGNGPPTSQYGGTGVGGMKGTAVQDSWGLMTSFGTGLRVAQVCSLVDGGLSVLPKAAVKILLLITMDDTSQSLHKFLDAFLNRAQGFVQNVEFVVVNVLDKTIKRCLGCAECPNSGVMDVGEVPSSDKHAHCRLSGPEDVMEEIHELMLDADGIIIAGLNVKHHHELVYRYQVLMERTRYIRRNNFELTNKLMTSLSLTQVGATINSLHSVKTVTSYIRHNTIMHRPVEAYTSNGELIEDGMEDFVHFVNYARIMKMGKGIVDIAPPEYSRKGIGGY